MSRVVTIYRRELGYFYNSIIAYVVTMVFVLLAGYFFYNLVGFFNLAYMQVMQNPVAARQLSLTEGVLRPFFSDVSVLLLLIVPMITMRLFAEEKKMGTAELLFTYPISDWDAIIGKYAAAVSSVSCFSARPTSPPASSSRR
jgi:ABC-2 type transport system permease protein